MPEMKVTPTLFIGFGGSGAKTLSGIKKILSENSKRSFPDSAGAASALLQLMDKGSESELPIEIDTLKMLLKNISPDAVGNVSSLLQSMNTNGPGFKLTPEFESLKRILENLSPVAAGNVSRLLQSLNTDSPGSGFGRFKPGELKKLLSLVKAVLIPPCFQFLEFDDDKKDALNSGVVMSPSELPSGLRDFRPDQPWEYTNCNTGITSRKLDTYVEKEKGDYKYIKPWWPKKLGETLDPYEHIKYFMPHSTEYHHRNRHFGKHLLWMFSDIFVAKVCALSALCETLTTPEAAALLSVLYPGMTVASNFQICVVSSIAGEIGSGMLIDGLALLRTYIKHALIRTYILLPSVYSKVIKNETEPLVNAYATMKEYDYFYRQRKKEEILYQAKVNDRIRIDLRVSISNYTYLIGGRTEGNMSFDGEGIDVCQRVATLIANGIMGFFEEEMRSFYSDKIIRCDLYPLNGDFVSACYQSPGVHELRYPNREIRDFIRTYAMQVLAASLCRKNEMEADFKKADGGNAVSHLDSEASIGQRVCREEFRQCPEFEKFSVTFFHTQADEFLSKNASIAARTIRKAYCNAKEMIEAIQSGKEPWPDQKTHDLTGAGSGLFPGLGEVFTDFPDWGLSVIDLCLQLLMNEMKKPVSTLNVFSDEDYAKLENEFIHDFPGLLSFRKTKLSHIDRFLSLLKQDIDARIENCCRFKRKKIGDDMVFEYLEKFTSLVSMLEGLYASCSDKTKQAIEDMKDHERMKEWFGCSFEEIELLKEKIKCCVAEDFRSVARRIGRVMEDRHYDNKQIEEEIRSYAENVFVNHPQLHDDSLDIVDRLQEYIEHNRRSDESEEHFVEQYFYGLLQYALPMNLIEDPDETVLHQWIIANVPQSKVAKLRDMMNLGPVMQGPGLQYMSMPCMDPYSLLLVQMRRDLTANDLPEINDCYKSYCSCNKNPSPNKYSEIHLSAHLFDDRKMNEIVKTAPSPAVVEIYFTLGRNLQIIGPSEKGKKTTWLKLIDPGTQKVFAGPFWGERKVKEELCNNNTLFKNLQAVMIETLCSMFIGGTAGQLKYMEKYGGDAETRSKKVPAEIERTVASNRGWDL